MDDIIWPPKKQPTLKIVPGPRSKPEIKKTKKPTKNAAKAIIVAEHVDEPTQTGTPVESTVTEGTSESSTTATVADAPTPEPTAVEPDSSQTEEDSPQTPSLTPADNPKNHWLYFKHSRLSKQQWVIVVAVLVVLIGGSVFAATTLYHNSRHVASQGKVARGVPKTPVAKPTTEASLLTGIQVDPALNKRPVTGIMIENSPDARPQSGLKDAGVVYEAIAEGGITRFLTLFQEAQPDYIGPVRSVRPYYLDFLMPYDAAIAHVGGAPQALADIKSLGIKDLDQFFNSQAYTRISERFAPHNVYTSFAKLDELNTSKGFTSSTFTGFKRKAEAPTKAAPTAKSIDFDISGPLYNAHYDYRAEGNLYDRSEGGGPHKDDKSGAQLKPKVVIALVMQRGVAGDGQHTEYVDTGTGHMYVFQDGTVTEGSWQKADRHAQFVFIDGAGQPLPINPGQTWITLVDSNAAVSYTP